MAQCQARNKRSEQCRNRAVEGSDYCDVAGHGPAVAVGAGADSPPPAPAPGGADPLAWLADLAADAGPAAEPAAAPGDLPPPPVDAPADDGTDWLEALDVPDAAPERASRWTPENTGRIVNPALNALFERTGKPVQKPAEEKYTAEVFAPIFDDLLSRVDPNSPWGALSLWCLAVPLPRYAGELARAVMPGRRGAPAASPPPSVERPATPAPAGAFAWE